MTRSTPRLYTVIGGAGHVGSRLVAKLTREGHDVRVVTRDQPTPTHADLGHVLYAAGVTSDFRRRPRDTVEAHVGRLAEVLDAGRFAALVYLSSARLYRHADAGEETAAIRLDPAAPGALYDASKVAGETLCHAAAAAGAPVRIARLAHVYAPTFSGPGFLDQLVRAASAGALTLETSPASTRTFVRVDDAVEAIGRLAHAGRHVTYNLGAPEPVRHDAIVDILVDATGCSARVDHAAPLVTEPPLAIERAARDLDFRPRLLLDELPALVRAHVHAAAAS